nr:hypothetical protein GCM10020092_106460 [Actinoplanes digitatis]
MTRARTPEKGTIPTQEGIACHKVRLAEAGSLAIRIYQGQSINWRLLDAAGQQVCQEYNTQVCVLAAGDYSVITSNDGWEEVNYQIAAARVSANAGCARATSLSWAPDPLVVHQTSAVQTNCQPFAATAGDRVIVYRAPDQYNEVRSFLVNAAGEQVCTERSEDEDGCVLSATGTYRVVSYLDTFDAEDTDLTYRLQVRRLSQPAGCPMIRPGAWNGAPAGAIGPIRCRILAVTQPGVYLARAYDDENYETGASVYDGTGHRVCVSGGHCELPAAGRYTMVLNGGAVNSVLGNDFAYATAFLPYTPSGCPQDAGTSFTATFTAPGQYLCRAADPAGRRQDGPAPAHRRPGLVPAVRVRRGRRSAPTSATRRGR